LTRTFQVRPAAREQVPVLVGLVGPSGSGKTYSALRLASGVQQVTGGEIFFIDTEARRALHYAGEGPGKFKFQHIDFGAPFGSLDYLDAIRQCAEAKAGVIVVDSMSHEHEGPGGMIDWQDQILTQMAGDDYGKRERMAMLAWQKPKAARRTLLNGIVQMGVSCIMCFRAGEKTKPIKDQNGKLKPTGMGFTPLAGPEFVYEMTMSALLYPRSDGVPTWDSDLQGERMAMKLPGQFRQMFAKGAPLSEDHGRLLAEWARGGAPGQGQTQGQTTTTGGSELTLSQRAGMYEERLKAAPNLIKLKAVREANARLREALDSAEPELMAELEQLFSDRCDFLEEAERSGEAA
jgi:ABC-type oligopeptide transport system ATPase subunit